MTLREVLGVLGQVMTDYRGSAAHVVSDFVLYNLAFDVREQAEAVVLQQASAFRRASFANARAAFESAIDLSYLVENEAEYDRRGARARMYELFEYERLQLRAELITTRIPGSSEALEKAVREDVAEWNSIKSGQGRLLIEAWETYSRNPPGVGEHWSGLGRMNLYGALGNDECEKEETAKMLDTIYAMLSIATHPRARTGQRLVELVNDDHVTIAVDDDKQGLARGAAELAVKHAIRALQRRQAFA